MNHYLIHPTPLRPLLIVASGRGISSIDFITSDSLPLPPDATEQETPLLQQAAAQLTEYFSGQRHHFDLPLDEHGTPFQLRVWSALRRIPYGETRSYKQLAVAIGSPKAFRAVGMANNRNPISIVTPCHRVIGSDGSLVGYAGGIELKRALLDIEKCFSNNLSQGLFIDGSSTL